MSEGQLTAAFHSKRTGSLPPSSGVGAAGYGFMNERLFTDDRGPRADGPLPSIAYCGHGHALPAASARINPVLRRSCPADHPETVRRCRHTRL